MRTTDRIKHLVPRTQQMSNSQACAVQNSVIWQAGQTKTKGLSTKTLSTRLSLGPSLGCETRYLVKDQGKSSSPPPPGDGVKGLSAVWYSRSVIWLRVRLLIALYLSIRSKTDKPDHPKPQAQTARSCQSSTHENVFPRC